jgi:hypothetical protein
VGGIGGAMSAKANRNESVLNRAHVVSQQLLRAWIAFAFIASLMYGGYEYLNWFSLVTARVVLALSVASLWGSIFLIKLRCPLNCVLCGLDLFKFSYEIKKAKWRYCPGCACATDVQPSQDKFDRIPKRATSLVAAYQIENAADTTRRRARHWRNAMLFITGNFFLFMCIVMLGAFIGPWMKEIAAHWHWVMLTALAPFVIWKIIEILYGLRCVHCDHKFRTDTQAFLVAYKKLNKRFWHFCPHCAHSLDTPKSVATSTRI